MVVSENNEVNLPYDRIAQVYNGQAGSKYSQERAKARIDWIVAQTQGHYILDIGCSEGIVPLLLARQGLNVVAMDINPKSIQYAENLLSFESEDVRGRVELIITDALEYESNKKYFDTVILGEIIEHLEDPAPLIQKAVSLLKPNGNILITTPFGYFPDPDHRQTFSLRSFLSLVENDICVEEIEVVDGYIRCVGKINQQLTKNKYDIFGLLELTESATIVEQKRYRQLLEDQTDETRKVIQENKKNLAVISKLNEQIKSSEQAIIENQSQINNQQIELDDKQNELDDKQNELDDKQNELDNKQNELNALNEKYLISIEDVKNTRGQLNFYIEQFQKYRNAFIDMENSIAYRVGNLLKLAVKHPGNKTLLLPIELVKLFFDGLERIKKRRLNSPTGENDDFSSKQEFQIKKSILGIKNLQKKKNISIDFTLPSEINNFQNLKIASIMDQFTFHSFDPECKLMQITPDKWKEQLEQFKPHLFFLESAWQGQDRLWYRQIDKVSSTLLQVISWCNENKIPLVFWNKEDPIHFNTFIQVAALCDFIFTTDIELIPQYKAICGHDRVFLLPFAAQPKIHNPIGKYERKNAFCFAGAYYAHFSERVRDLEMMFNSLSSLGDFEIYDRNAYPDNPNYQFPEKFKMSIQGTLDPSEIDRAYKGYKFGVNLNTIKQSQTMFARRVYELLASNTVTISNYSRGLRNLLGDLVLCSDNGNQIQACLSKYFIDEIVYRKFRLAGLRKVMQKNTYQDRLGYIVEKVFNQKMTNFAHPITCVAFVNNEAEYKAVISSFSKQSYSYKKLFLVSNYLSDNEMKGYLSDDCMLLNYEDHQNKLIENYVKDGYIAIFHPDDYYGNNYLLDLSLATRYTQSKKVGKSSFYNFESEKLHLQGDGKQYTYGRSIPLRCGMISSELVTNKNFSDLLGMLNNIYLEENPDTFSIDEFNYCKNFSGKTLSEVDDLPIYDQGKDIQHLLLQAENLKPIDTTSVLIYPDELKALFSDEDQLFYEINYFDGALDLYSRLDNDKHIYIYSKSCPEVELLDLSNDSVCLFSTAGTLELSLVLIWLSEDKEKLGSIIINRYKSTQLDIPEGTKFVQIGLRLQGKGHSSIKSIKLSKKEAERNKTWVGKSDVLLLTNIYPSYDDLYRNAFVHRRVLGYHKEGVNVDVFRFSSSLTQKYYEFQGVDVSTGGEELLESLLASGQYKKVLVHFLDQGMWNVLKKYLEKVKVIIWIHGSEIQPWWRREFNYRTKEEKNQAINESTLRQNFWNEIFAHDQTNLHFVFVSKYMANEVVEDYKIELQNIEYSIIHNFIDTNLFNFLPKTIELRKKVISIRPFISNKYANDLTINTILELSKYPFFEDLEFHIIGDGCLFEEIVHPIIQFRNVILEKKFITQDEISNLYKKYGLFLNPTRWDSQGVSRDEAMASGLIPLTNNVTAIPEFVDEECGILAPEEDYMELVNGIIRLYQDPELFLKMSELAAKRVRDQSSFIHTIHKEINLIKNNEKK